MKELQELEAAAGHHFKDPGLLEMAMTHSSYYNEHRKSSAGCNERLEFLGDAVLETVSSEYLYRRYPEKKEGELSRLRAAMVCEPSLAKCARAAGIPEQLRLGHGEEHLGGRNRDSLTSDALEALIGAVYLDAGFAAAADVVKRLVLTRLEEEDLFIDRKTLLQEMAQEDGLSVEYRLLKEEGPAHMKTFTVEALIGGRVLGTGTGHTKKAAEQAAAREAMARCPGD
ncbi:MAG: ribonuclease III [Lachnospiraceae bacterium]|nr:ribonuclease III [Lachnospiraceae bacterium]